jgi:predicted amidohydrolase
MRTGETEEDKKMGFDIYTACAMQAEVFATRERSDIKRNLRRCLELIDVAPEASLTAKDGYSAESWAPVKLVCFNEFFIQGHDATWSFEHYMKEVVVEVPGEETEQLSKKAREHNIYISGCVLEYLEGTDRICPEESSDEIRT